MQQLPTELWINEEVLPRRKKVFIVKILKNVIWINAPYQTLMRRPHQYTTYNQRKFGSISTLLVVFGFKRGSQYSRPNSCVDYLVNLTAAQLRLSTLLENCTKMSRAMTMVHVEAHFLRKINSWASVKQLSRDVFSPLLCNIVIDWTIRKLHGVKCSRRYMLLDFSYLNLMLKIQDFWYEFRSPVKTTRT